jgi:hypothetical protein
MLYIYLYKYVYIYIHIYIDYIGSISTASMLFPLDQNNVFDKYWDTIFVWYDSQIGGYY